MVSDVKRLVKELQSIMSGANTFKHFLLENLILLLLMKNINICSKVGAGLDLQAAADFMTQGSW